MRFLFQTNTYEGSKEYGISFFTEENVIDNTSISYKVVYGIKLLFGKKAHFMGIGIPTFKTTK